jgi:hypothetical protein
MPVPLGDLERTCAGSTSVAAAGTFAGLASEGAEVIGVQQNPVQRSQQRRYPPAQVRAESFADTCLKGSPIWPSATCRSARSPRTIHGTTRVSTAFDNHLLVMALHAGSAASR